MTALNILLLGQFPLLLVVGLGAFGREVNAIPSNIHHFVMGGRTPRRVELGF